MKFNPEFFSSEVIMQRLVEWFNAQPLNQRTITAGEFVIIRVKVLVTPNGEPVFVIGSDPSDITDPTREYIGEAVFIWVGTRGNDLTATSSSFFEISKFVNSTINIKPFNAVVKYPPAKPLVLRTSYSWLSPPNLTAPYTIGLTGNGLPDSPSIDPTPMPTDNIDSITDIAAYAKAIVARKSDGSVWGWGDTLHEISQFTSLSPTPIMFDSPVRRVVMLEQMLVVLHTDGTISTLGSTVFTPIDISSGGLWGDDWATGGFTGMLPNITQYTSIVDIKGYARNVDGVDAFEQYVILKRADGTLATWGATVSNLAGDTPVATGGALATINQPGSTLSQVDIFEVNCGTLFVLHDDGTVTLVGDRSSQIDVQTSVDGELCISVAVAGNGSVGYIDSAGRAYAYPMDNAGVTGDGWVRIEGDFEGDKAVGMAAGQDHIVILTASDCMNGVSGEYNGSHTSLTSLTKPTRQIFAGQHSTGALYNDGSVEWFFDQA